MTPDELKSFISEMIAFFSAVNRVVPNKVDSELISWLTAIEDQPWTLELIVSIFNIIKLKK